MASTPRAGRWTVSVVIPTRNRPKSLARTLRALARQERLPDEVFVVDSSDEPLDEEALREGCPALALTCLHAPPNVCAQRNAGIRRATGSHVLLLDDDIEPPPEYLGTLADYLEGHPSVGAVSGILSEPDASGTLSTAFSVPSLRTLLFAFLFQRTLFADVEAARAGPGGALPLALLKRWYRRRGNTWSAAGWPLLTQVRDPVILTATYGLGAALVTRAWLLASPFDERLGPHGIGDNYGVALGFPSGQRIAVLKDLPVLHHRSSENRLDPAEAYFRRVLALDYFLRTSGRFTLVNTAFLAWSLVGNAVVFALRRRGTWLRRTVRGLWLVVGARNPLLAEPPHAAPPLTPAGSAR